MLKYLASGVEDKGSGMKAKIGKQGVIFSGVLTMPHHTLVQASGGLAHRRSHGTTQGYSRGKSGTHPSLFPRGENTILFPRSPRIENDGAYRGWLADIANTAMRRAWRDDHEVPSGEFHLFPLFEVVTAGTSNHEQQLKSRVLVPVQRVRTEARVGGQIIDHAAAQFPARQRNIMTTQRYRCSDDWKFGSCLRHCEIVRRMNSKKLLRKEPKLRTIFFPP